MIKTSIDLTSDQYQFLKIKALERKMKGEDPSFVTILRELIDEDHKKWKQIPKLVILFILGLLCVSFSLPAHASYLPFNTNVNMNVGIGTATPQGALVVMNGNVGIGTWVPGDSFTVNGSSILGVAASSTDSITSSGTGSLAGGEASHIVNLGSIASSGNGSLAFGYAQGAAGPSYIISNSSGSIAMGYGGNAGTLESEGSGSIAMGYASGGATLESDGNGSIAMGYAFGGGGTLLASGTASVAMGQNVQATAANSFAFGMGLINPNASSLMVGFTNGVLPTLTVTGTGVGIGTSSPFGGGLIVLPASTGNVGIGSLTPGQALDVNGTVRTTGFTLTGNGAANGNVLVGNSIGVGTWMPASTLLGGSGSNYWSLNGGAGNVGINTSYAVGIGTSFVGGTGEAALSVMNGNVGIGTWVPGNRLDIVGGNIGIGTAYNLVGIGTTSTILTLHSDASSIYVGWQAGASTTAGGEANTAVGYQTLNADTIGTFNAALGWGALSINTAGGSNSAMGYGALFQNTVGNQNSAMGALALEYLNGLYADNTAMGYGAGEYISGHSITLTNATQSTFLGDSTAALANGDTNETVIGYNAVGNGSNTVTLGNASVTSTILQGNIGIGSSAPGQKLDVQGTVRTTGFTLTGNGAANGNVLVGNSIGVGTWMPASTLLGGSGSNYWSLNGGAGNVGINTSYAVGIGTSFVGGTGEAALSVMNGNVGIGTWLPSSALTFSSTGIGTVYGATWDASELYPFSAGGLQFNVYSGLNIDDNNGAGLSLSPGHNFGFYHYGDSSGTTSNFFFFTTTNNITALSTANGNLVQTASNFAPTSGAYNYSAFAISDTINQTGTSTGITRGVFVNPTLTSALDFRAIETAVGNVGIGTISGNLGIGSQWPGQRLDVNGTARMSGFTLTGNGAGNGNVLVGNSVGVGTWMPVSTLGVSGGSGTNYWLLNGGAGNVGINTSYAVGIGTTFVGGTGEAALSVMNGNVGIGTWVPRATLDVEGTLSVTSFRGNVGIGTLLPATYLDVSGPSTGGIPQIRVQEVGNNTGALTEMWNNAGDVVGMESGGTNCAGVSCSTGQSDNQQLYASKTLFVTSGAYVQNGGTSDIYFLTGGWDPTTQIRMTIDSMGNVGIGSLAPQGTLDVEGGTAAASTNGSSINIAAQNAGSGNQNGGNIYLTPGTYTGGGSRGSVYVNNFANLVFSSGSTINWGAGAPSILASTSPNNHLLISSSGGNDLYINSSGNVGLGSAAPGQVLDVQGTVRATGLTLTGNGAGNGNVLVGNSVGVGTWMPVSTLGVSGGAGTNYWLLNGGGNVGINTSHAVGIGTTFVGGTGEAALSVMNGNVGIGTWVPQFSLSINGNLGVGTIIPGGSLAVTSTGNVGIGTWAPSAPLFVTSTTANNSVYISNSARLLNIPVLDVDASATNGTPIAILGNINSSSPTSGEAVEGTTMINGGTSYAIYGAASNSQVGNAGSIDYGGYFTATGVSASTNYGVYTSASGGTNNYALITGTGNVGIGSTAPGQMLDVNGTARMGGLTLTGNGAANGNVLVSNSVGVGTWMPASTLGVSGGAGTNYWLLNGGGNVGINTTQAVGIGTSFVGGTGEAALSVMNGNVGIGTWVPGNLFQVGNGVTPPLAVTSAGVVTTGSTLNVGNFANLNLDSGSSIVWAGGVPNITGSFSPNGLNLSETGGNDIDINGKGNVGIGTALTYGGMAVMNGNVGIGTWVPALMLDVNGTARMSGLTLTGNGAGNGNVLVGNSVGVGTWMPVSTLGVSGGSGTNYWLLNGGAGNVGINTSNAVGIGTTFVGGSGEAALSVMKGNVGIGTWVPNQELAVVGGAILENQIGSTVDTVLIGDPPVGGYPGIWLGSNASAPSYSNYSFLSDGTGGNLFNAASGQLTRFRINNSATLTAGGTGVRIFGADTGNPADAPIYPFQVVTTNNNFIINSSGNVGISTISPVSKLNVNGGIGIGTALTNGAYLNFNAAPSGGLIVQGNVGIGTFNPFGGGLIVLPANTGNVGIGSLAPGQALDVTGTVRMTGLTLTGNGAANGNVLVGNSIGVGTWMPASTLGVSGGSGTNYWLLNGGAGNVGINTSYAVGIGTSFVGGSGEAALSIMNGNVGIGTWTPADPLYVISTGGDIAVFQNNNVSADGDIGFKDNTGTSKLWMGYGNSSSGAPYAGISFIEFDSPNFAIYNNNGAVLNAYFTSTGNVGIGTLSPSSKLDVNGGVGIGTSLTNGTYLSGSSAPSGGLIVQGNVGIGTWLPVDRLDVTGGNIGISTAFNLVGIGTFNTIMTMHADTLSIYLGWQAGSSVTQSGEQNTAVGSSSLLYNTTGTQNSALGDEALQGNTTASYSTAVGTAALNGSNAFANTAVGAYALVWNTTGQLNTALGEYAGYIINGGGPNQTSNNSIFIGAQNGPFNSGDTNEIVIGNGAIGIGSYSVELGNSQIATTQLQGNVGIGTSLPTDMLQVDGTVSGGGTGMSVENRSISGFTALNFKNSSDGYAGIIGYGNAGWSDINEANNVFIESFSGNVMLEANNVVMQPGGTGNVGIGTETPQAAFAVTDGNVGIGTWTAAGGQLIIKGVGNVGIGSAWPGQVLDVQGTVRSTGFTLTGNGAANGSVLVGNSVGVGTWMATLTLPAATVTAETPGDVTYYSTTNGFAGGSGFQTNGTNVGIGTSNFTKASLQVVGNIGIGTVKNGDNFINTLPPNGGMIVEGNVGIGTWAPSGALTVMNGNVGIGTWTTASALNVEGTISAIASGATASLIPGSVGANEPAATFQIGNSASDVIFGAGFAPSYSSNADQIPGGIAISTDKTPTDANEEQLNILLAIGSGTVPSAAIIGTVQSGSSSGTNGLPLVLSTQNNYSPAFYINNASTQNIGIGTVVPSALLEVGNRKLDVLSGGNIGIGSINPGQLLDVQGTLRDLGQLVNGNVGIGTTFINGTGESALTVMNGNVGLGTWLPAYNLDMVNGTSRSRPVRRISSITETVTSTVTINSNTTDVEEVSGFNNAAGITLTFANPSPSNPNDADFLEIRVKDGGTAITIAYGANFASTTTTMPLTTVASTWLRILFEYNSTTGLWECVAST